MEIYVEKIEVPGTLSIEAGKTKQLNIKIFPENATEKELILESKFPQIATIDENGLIIANKEGYSIISVKSINGKKAVCNLTVTEKIIPVESVSLDPLALDMRLYQTKHFKVSVLPENATNPEYTLTNSNPEVVVLLEDESVRAIGVGKATITAATKDGKVGKCEITVSDDPIEAEEIQFQNPISEIYIDKTVDINAIVLPTNCQHAKLTWKSSDENIAVIQQWGLLEPKSPGHVKITATTENGVSNSLEIDVLDIKYPDGVLIAPQMIMSPKRRSYEKSYISVYFCNVHDFYNKELSWSISDNSKIDFKRTPEGEIELYNYDYPVMEIKEGAVTGDKATVTVTDDEGNQSTCEITVNMDGEYKYVEYLKQGNIQPMNVGEKIKIPYTVHPEDAVNQAVKIFNTDESVVSIDDEGNVIALKKGVSNVVVFSLDNGYYKKYRVEVK